MRASLLPPNTTGLERHIAEATAGLGELPTPLRELWDPWRIPAPLLPYLAWALSIETEWGFARDEHEQRTLVAAAVELHRYKGTPYAVRRGMQLLGFRDAEILEGLDALRHDGEPFRDGSQRYAGDVRWALFRVAVDLGNQEGLDAERVTRIHAIVRHYQNARSHLHAVSFRANLSAAVDRSTTIALPLAVGWQPVRAKGVRDGRLRRGSIRPYRRDGELRFDGTLDRTARVVTATTHYRTGEIFVTHALGVRLRPRLTREALLPRDGRLAFDGTTRRGEARTTVAPLRLRVARALRRDGRVGRQGFGPARDGSLTYAEARPRGARYRHATTTRHEAFA